jgi:hypothetical protein
VEAVRKGAYVLATKWSDADPGDHWCVGFYDELKWGDRHIILDNDGKPFRASGFRHVYPITDAEGRWLIERIPAIEATMFQIGHDEWGDEIRLGKSVLEWLADARSELNK